jgi:hypothetical protein
MPAACRGWSTISSLATHRRDRGTAVPGSVTDSDVSLPQLPLAEAKHSTALLAGITHFEHRSKRPSCRSRKVARHCGVGTAANLRLGRDASITATPCGKASRGYATPAKSDAECQRGRLPPALVHERILTKSSRLAPRPSRFASVGALTSAHAKTDGALTCPTSIPCSPATPLSPPPTCATTRHGSHFFLTRGCTWSRAWTKGPILRTFSGSSLVRRSSPARYSAARRPP